MKETTRKRVNDWLKKGGINKIKRALQDAKVESDSYQKAARVDRTTLNKPMTV